MITFVAGFGITLCFLMFLSGCATPGANIAESPSFSPSGTALVWPPSPQPARIRYLGSISVPADIGVKKSSIKRALDAFFGGEEVEGIMIRPYGIFAGAEKIYVTDPGIHALHVFDTRHREYSVIKDAGKEELLSPIGIAVDEEGAVYVSDSMLKKVFVFDRKGKYIRQIGSADMFARPAGVALGGDKVYVVDTHGHCVSVFNKADGKFLFRFGKNGTAAGEFNYPTNIFAGKDDRLYITDSLNFRVQIFDKDGQWVGSFGKQGNGSGDFSKPKGIAVDSEGHIYVADADFDIVQIFDGEGSLLLAFGNAGRAAGQMVLPAGVFIDDKDTIYLADSYNSRIQLFQYLPQKKESK